MAIKKIETLLKGIEDNAGMIVVYKHHTDGTCSVVHRSFRTSSVRKVLKKVGLYSVEQK